jgi:hypothetical protein
MMMEMPSEGEHGCAAEELPKIFNFFGDAERFAASRF